MFSPHRVLRIFQTNHVLLPFVLFFIENLSEQLLEVPNVRLVEKTICDRFYQSAANGNVDRSNGNDEVLCKIPEVQNMLSVVIGWHKSFDAAPGLLAFFFGLLAEKYGRHFVASLSMTGMLCANITFFVVCLLNNIFPVQLVWLSSLFLFLGGGTVVFDAMTFSIVADATIPSNKTTVLLILMAVHHVIRFVFPPVASLIMSYSLYLPFFLAFGVLAFGVALAWIGTFMETRAVPQLHAHHGQEEAEVVEPLLDEGDISSTAPLILKPNSPLHTGPAQFWPSAYRSAVKTAAPFRSPYLLFTLFTIFFKKTAFSAEGFMFQYASEKFGWELRKTTVFRSANAAGATMATLILWPMFMRIMVNKGFQRSTLEIFIIRTSLFIGMVSFFTSWEATSGLALAVAMFGAGAVEGLHPTLQGSVASICGEGATAQIFTVLGTGETIGDFFSGPMMSRLVAIGRTASSPSSGVFFLVSSAIFGALFIWALFMKPYRQQRDISDTILSDTE